MIAPEPATQIAPRDVKFITVATGDFLPAVRVLAESLCLHEPAARLSCYLVGASLAEDEAAALPFDIRNVDALPIPDARRFFFQYTAKELCCALKPHVLADALRRDPAAVFLDADMLVCAPFGELFRDHLAGHAVLVTPHLLDPGPAPNLQTILRAGIYNAGVVAVRGGDEGGRFLDWWRQRVACDCIRDPHGGLSGDQRWLDLAVGLFEFVRPLRDPGVNVGYWNLHERVLGQSQGRVLVNGAVPLRLFHFSHVSAAGFAPFAAANMGPGEQAVALGLARRYFDELAQAAASCPRRSDYAWNVFADGSPVLPAHREAVRRGLAAVADPFAARAQVEAATPTDPVAAFGHRPGFWVESGPELLAGARAQLSRLRTHAVLGPVIALWKRWVNPDI